MGGDPREDKSGNKPSDKPVHPAPGGAGTGTRNDPAKEPAAQPNPPGRV